MSDIPNYESAYRDLRVRVTDLLRSVEPTALDAVAPATPEWRVRDVAAHLAGVCDDAVHGNMGGVVAQGELLVTVNNPERVNNWTDEHVTKRADWPVDQVLDDWAEHAVQVETSMNALHPAIGQMVADAVAHEHDIRGGLGHESGGGEVGAGEPVTRLGTTRFEIARAVTGRRSMAQIHAMGWDGPLDPSVLVLAPELLSPRTTDLVE